MKSLDKMRANSKPKYVVARSYDIVNNFSHLILIDCPNKDYANRVVENLKISIVPHKDIKILDEKPYDVERNYLCFDYEDNWIDK